MDDRVVVRLEEEHKASQVLKYADEDLYESRMVDNPKYCSVLTSQQRQELKRLQRDYDNRRHLAQRCKNDELAAKLSLGAFSFKHMGDLCN